MASSTFFVSWQLWEQMTFALACAIVMVFCTGLAKLYWTNRSMRQQEIIDSEKQERLTQMRKMGLQGSKRAGEVPFGVRAIQSGIEVDGIWISRPVSPVPHPERTSVVSRLASARMLVPGDGEKAYSRVRGKEVSPGHDAFSMHTASECNRPVPVARNAPESDADGNSFFGQGQRMDTHGASRREQGRLNEETLQNVEGRALVETYVPTTAFARPRVHGFRGRGSSTSSSATSLTASESGSGHCALQSSATSTHPIASSVGRFYVPKQPSVCGGIVPAGRTEDN